MSDSTIAMIQVSSVPALAVSKGMVQITTRTRTSEKNPNIPEGQRSRSIIVPELVVTDVPSKFQRLLIAKLYELATAQLAGIWKENPQVSEVPAALWSIDSLLTYFSREAESNRLTKDSIAAWLKQSKLGALLEEKKAKNWQDRILGLAAPVLQLSEEDCTKVIATLGKFEEDTEHLICQQLIARIQNRLELLRKQNQEVTELEAL